MTTKDRYRSMNTRSANNAWMVDYFYALLAVQEEVENDRPESDGGDPDHALKLAKARTELLNREKRSKSRNHGSPERP